MLELLKRYWWMVAVRGAAALLFGLLALIWPDITISALVLLFGAFALVDGIFAVAAAAFGDRRTEGRRVWLLLAGLAGVAAGVVTFAWPGITTLVLLWWIAAWALVTGVLEIAAIRLRRGCADSTGSRSSEGVVPRPRSPEHPTRLRTVGSRQREPAPWLGR